MTCLILTHKISQATSLRYETFKYTSLKTDKRRSADSRHKYRVKTNPNLDEARSVRRRRRRQSERSSKMMPSPIKLPQLSSLPPEETPVFSEDGADELDEDDYR